MLNSKLELYLNGSWEEIHIYNRCAFDDRADGQLNSGVCYIITNTRRTDFKPKRRARLVTWDDTGEQWESAFFAYFKGQQRGPAYWMWEVTLVGVEQQVQRQMIDGLRVIQNDSNSITLYDTLQRLCNATPLRIVGQTPKYCITTDADIVSVLQKIPSPEYAWSCRTLLWECLKEIGCDMGGYLPKLQWYENEGGALQYEIGFFPTGKITETLNDLHYVSYAFGHEVNDVCSAVDTDIANIIPANQETASVVYPAPNAWITPRTEEVRLTTDNSKILMPETIEKIVKIYINTNTFSLNIYTESDGHQFMSAADALETSMLDVTDMFVEYKEWLSFEIKGMLNLGLNDLELKKNNTCYWTEDTNEISILIEPQVDNWTVINFLIRTAILRNYGTGVDGSNLFYINGEEKNITGVEVSDIRNLQFRIEYIPRGNSTKLHAVKQEKCDFESVIPFNQRAEIVDAESLSRELKKEVNQRGVDYAKIVHFYSSLEEIPQRGAAFTVGNDVYTITVNEYEQTNNQNIKVTHTFAKNWALQSSYLKQNKEYRNTNIPTDILERNLHYEDYLVIDEVAYTDNDGALGTEGNFLSDFLKTFSAVPESYVSEVNIASFYGRSYGPEQGNNEGGIVSVSSFAAANSIVFSAKTKNNLSVGIQRGGDGDEDEDYCRDVFYTNDNGELYNDTLCVQFGRTLINNFVDLFPHSVNTTILSVEFVANAVASDFSELNFYVDKSSAEQTNLTYQAHVVSALSDIVIGEMITRENPLICQIEKKNISFRIWGLRRRLPKTATVVDSQYGVQLAAWTSQNLYVIPGTNSVRFRLTRVSRLVGYGYVGWALTDDDGRLYLAKNSTPTGDITLYFNYRHTFHGEE